jgi:F-box and WD-40 domain protein MET30
MCCFSQLSLLTEQLSHLIRVDPFTVLPREVSLKILGYVDATSLCRAAQVSKHWKSLADDDILWRGICEQHIGQKCHKCGWGLPRLDKKRIFRVQSTSPCPSPALQSSVSKREPGQGSTLSERPQKRQRLDPSGVSSPHRSDWQPNSTSTEFESHSDELLVPIPSNPSSRSVTRPWKSVYSERLTIERNWRRGRCTVQTLKGHSDGVMCLQFSETLSHPSFPILITGSYDRTIRVWNLETGVELRCLRGHTRAIRALQFDDVKLITGSMDHTIRIWDWRNGRCVRTLTGHTEGVVSLNFDSNVLASGSVDASVKVWNLRTGEAFTLRGHEDWVNAVQLWDSNPNSGRPASPSTMSMFDSLPSGGVSSPSPATCSAHQIDPGKMLFSASDDGTIRLWDLTLRTCIRQYTGHVGQVQSMKLLIVDDGCDDEEREHHIAFQEAELEESEDGLGQTPKLTKSRLPQSTSEKHPKTVLISGSLDNTIKLWDIDTGKAVRTLFGHIEGVWAVASDKLRLVSGSHDRTIKVRGLFEPVHGLSVTLDCIGCRFGIERMVDVRQPLWVTAEL